MLLLGFSIFYSSVCYYSVANTGPIQTGYTSASESSILSSKNEKIYHPLPSEGYSSETQLTSKSSTTTTSGESVSKLKTTGNITAETPAVSGTEVLETTTTTSASSATMEKSSQSMLLIEKNTKEAI